MKLLSCGPAPRQDRAASELLHDEPSARVVAFHLDRGQEVREHTSESTVLVQVVSGRGTFTGDARELQLGAGDSVVYAPGEPHGMRAVDEPLRFIVIITPRPGG